ncbi:MAG: SDR family oxidoreductase [Ilumatobacteraceae bacterium]
MRHVPGAVPRPGPVDLLVNNAGYGELALIVDMTDDQWTKVIDLCLTGPFLVSRAWAQRLIAVNLPGAAVNISSLNYTAATDGLSAYCSAKAGVAQFTKVCASEWGRFGLRVNAVAPGATQTELTRVNGLLSGQMADEFVGRTPLGRFGETDDIARGVALLLSDDAGWISGVTLSVDGGAHIKGLHSYWDVAQADLAAAGGAS